MTNVDVDTLIEPGDLVRYEGSQWDYGYTQYIDSGTEGVVDRVEPPSTDYLEIVVDWDNHGRCLMMCPYDHIVIIKRGSENTRRKCPHISFI